MTTDSAQLIADEIDKWVLDQIETSLILTEKASDYNEDLLFDLAKDNCVEVSEGTIEEMFAEEMEKREWCVVQHLPTSDFMIGVDWQESEEDFKYIAHDLTWDEAANLMDQLFDLTLETKPAEEVLEYTQETPTSTQSEEKDLEV